MRKTLFSFVYSGSYNHKSNNGLPSFKQCLVGGMERGRGGERIGQIILIIRAAWYVSKKK